MWRGEYIAEMGLSRRRLLLLLLLTRGERLRSHGLGDKGTLERRWSTWTGQRRGRSVARDVLSAGVAMVGVGGDAGREGGSGIGSDGRGGQDLVGLGCLVVGHSPLGVWFVSL